MNSAKVYRLAAGVQVRREKFGLLFYDYRGPRLYFVPSGDLIDSDFFTGRQSLHDLLAAFPAGVWGYSPARLRQRLQQVLEMLEAKGLIHGKSLC